MKDAPFQWAVCGGFALDLFLNRDVRMHGDIDLCVFERDRNAVLQYMLERGWNVYEFRGWGKVRPLCAGMESDAGRNLMCTKDGCDLVQFYPCEDEGLLYHQFFHTGLKAFNYLEVLFSTAEDDYLIVDINRQIKREISQALLHQDGIPYLAPEVALLYKAANAENPDYQFDFEQTFPHLDEEQKAWFTRSMRLIYPEGHAWL